MELTDKERHEIAQHVMYPNRDFDAAPEPSELDALRARVRELEAAISAIDWEEYDFQPAAEAKLWIVSEALDELRKLAV